MSFEFVYDVLMVVSSGADLCLSGGAAHKTIVEIQNEGIQAGLILSIASTSLNHILALRQALYQQVRHIRVRWMFKLIYHPSIIVENHIDQHLHPRSTAVRNMSYQHS